MISPDGQATVIVVTGGMAVKCPVTVGLQENGLTEVSGATITPDATFVDRCIWAARFLCGPDSGTVATVGIE